MSVVLLPKPRREFSAESSDSNCVPRDPRRHGGDPEQVVHVQCSSVSQVRRVLENTCATCPRVRGLCRGAVPPSFRPLPSRFTPRGAGGPKNLFLFLVTRSAGRVGSHKAAAWDTLSGGALPAAGTRVRLCVTPCGLSLRAGEPPADPFPPPRLPRSPPPRPFFPPSVSPPEAGTQPITSSRKCL